MTSSLISYTLCRLLNDRISILAAFSFILFNRRLSTCQFKAEAAVDDVEVEVEIEVEVEVGAGLAGFST